METDIFDSRLYDDDFYVGIIVQSDEGDYQAKFYGWGFEYGLWDPIRASLGSLKDAKDWMEKVYRDWERYGGSALYTFIGEPEKFADDWDKRMK